jgi:hypothetical protein
MYYGSQSQRSLGHATLPITEMRNDSECELLYTCLIYVYGIIFVFDSYEYIIYHSVQRSTLENNLKAQEKLLLSLL